MDNKFTDSYGRWVVIEHEDADYISGHYIFPTGDKGLFRYRKSPVEDNTIWFAIEPWKFLKKQYDLEIDIKSSEALGNLLERKWIDLAYLLASLGDNEKRYDAIKLVLGPIAQYANENSREAWGLIPPRLIYKLITDDGLKYPQMKAMVPGLIAGVDYMTEREKHVYVELGDPELHATIDCLIVDNRETWKEACTTKPAMRNWFVGQIMKKFQGKVDASRVKAKVNEFADQDAKGFQ